MSKLKEKSGEIEVIAEQKKATERRLEENSSEIEILQGEINERNSRIEVLEAQLLKFDGSLADIAKSCDTLQNERERLHENLIRSNMEIQELSERIVALEDEKSKIQEELSRVSSELQEISSLRSTEATKVGEEVDRYQNEIESFTLKNLELAEMVSSLENQLKEMTQEGAVNLFKLENDAAQLLFEKEELSCIGL